MSHLVVFHVRGERFGIRSDRVERVVERVQIRPMPWLASPAIGVMGYRDVWIPVFDPAVPLGLTDQPAMRPTALVLRRGGARFGLLVDLAEGRRDLRAHGLPDQSGPRTVSGYEELEGTQVLSDERGLVALVDPDSLLPGESDYEEEPMDLEQPAVSTLSIVAFECGGARLGLHVDRVEEVLPWREPRALDGAPAFVRGVLDVRDRMVPVIDLAALLRLDGGAEASERTRILVVRVLDVLTGLIVDDVSDVRRVRADQVAPPPALVRGFAADRVDGIAQLDDRLLLLLRPDRLLDDEQRAQLADRDQEAAPPARPRKPAKRRPRGK